MTSPRQLIVVDECRWRLSTRHLYDGKHAWRRGGSSASILLSLTLDPRFSSFFVDDVKDDITIPLRPLVLLSSEMIRASACHLPVSLITLWFLVRFEILPQGTRGGTSISDRLDEISASTIGAMDLCRKTVFMPTGGSNPVSPFRRSLLNLFTVWLLRVKIMF